jgi:hypothetical protein
MSPAAELLADLQRRGLTLEAHDNKLRVRPKGSLTAAEQAAVRQHKPELLRLLGNAHRLYVPAPDPQTVREVLGAVPAAADLESLKHELACALWDLRDRWAGRQRQAGTIVVRGRPLVDWLRLDDVAAIIRIHGGGAR